MSGAPRGKQQAAGLHAKKSLAGSQLKLEALALPPSAAYRTPRWQGREGAKSCTEDEAPDSRTHGYLPRSLDPSLTSCWTGQGTIRYFAFGSNLGEEKLRNRGPNGTKIDFVTRSPAVARGHRLAFNMRMFPPLEPAMASIEPSEGEQCEGGACIEMDMASFDALWRSEGGYMD